MNKSEFEELKSECKIEFFVIERTLEKTDFNINN